MESSRKRHGLKVLSQQQINCLPMSQGVSSTAGFRSSELVLAVLKINRKVFLNETEIIWKSVCLKDCLLYCQLEHAYIFSYLSVSVCVFLFLCSGEKYCKDGDLKSQCR